VTSPTVFACALVVDDDPILLEVAASLLRKRGVKEVVLASNGAAALDVLSDRRSDISLIVCDLQMPEMDGIAFLRGLATCAYAGAVVVVSSMSDGVRSLALQLGRTHGLNVLGALGKPLNGAKLNALLDEAGAGNTGGKRQAEDGITDTSLRRALRDGLIVAYYQPKVDFATGRLIGAEALARWIKPDGSLVTPDRFIPLAERTGLISAVDRSVMKRAIADLPRLQSLEPTFRLSVNAGSDTLDDVGLYDMLVDALRANGIQPSALTLEVIESQALRKTASLLEVLGRLRLTGFELSIDDFGTGHSNLETLRAFPFTEIKIDRSFVKDALSCKSAYASVQSCLLLGRQLGMTIVAEGVESQEQWAFLEGTGATAAQGYLIAQPMPLIDMLAWMQQWEAGAHLLTPSASAA
jgi:EAL domain-containing protein (putative c-di-GMP-specific phosphodiesterase class I)/DNA-binding NarL/FixJ family response regulator